jgi:RsiW-degrading membrane proteinase PrsW (M82 family)
MDQKRPGGEMRGSGNHEPTRSQLLPMRDKWQDLPHKAFFWPGIITVITVLLLFQYAGHPDEGIQVHLPVAVVAKGVVIAHTLMAVTVPYYTVILALLITLGLAYAVYRVIGKKTVWWLMPAVAVTTAVLVQSPLMDLLQSLFRFGMSDPGSEAFVTGFVRMIFMAGLPEEIMKAIPVAAGVWIALKVTDRQSPAWALRVTEPLDGILIGVASGLGFAFVETVFQYVPKEILHHGAGSGLELMIPRLIGNISGHCAYAGVFGYYIGLAAMKPAHRVKLLLVGLAIAAGLHAGWDGAAGADSSFLMLVFALGSFGMLAAAIVKGREISPVRSQLLASQILDRPTPAPRAAAATAGSAPAGMSPAQGAPLAHSDPAAHPTPSTEAATLQAAPVQAAAAGPVAPVAPAKASSSPQRSITWDDSPDSCFVEIGTARVPMTLGTRLYERQAPGTKSSRGDSIVAEVNANPNDATMLGLKNLSNQIWHITTDDGDRRDLAPGRSVRIARGMRIALGDLVAVVK